MRGFKPMLTTGVLGLAASAAVVGMGVRSAARHDAVPQLTEQQQQAADAYAKLPVSFVENRGQTDPRVHYYARGDGYAFYMTPSEVMLTFANQDDATKVDETPPGVALALQFRNSNPTVRPHGAARSPGVINDFTGSDSSQWHTQIPQFREVVYPDLWPGIDLQLREQSGVLKYEFHVKPGASPSDIRLAYDGADDLGLTATGGLQISTPIGMLEDSVPLSYQTIGDVQVPVSSNYVLGNDEGFSFAVGDYQRDHELVIDPGVQYATFLGGNSDEKPANIAVDGSGNAYIGGTTQSPDFPTTAGAFDRTGASQNFAEAFVTKLNAAGSALVYSTFVGGSNMEFGLGLTIDAAGAAYVTGQTKSSNFPTTSGAFDRSLNIPQNCPRCVVDNTDNFVFKLNPAGSALAYSTYLGGTDWEGARGIAVDGGGNAYVTGETLSGDFPTTAGAVDRTSNGGQDMFVTKLNSTGSALVYSTFIGGTGNENGSRVAVDSANNAYVVGNTSSTDFPVTAGAFDTTANGAFDGTVTKLNAAGSAIVYATYLGGSDFDGVADVAVDSSGSAYVVGGTPSANFPVTPGAYDTTFNFLDAYVTKFNPAGSALVYSTFIGGSDSESIGSIVLDPANNAWLGGGTMSADFPVTADATDATYNGGGDGTVTELNATGSAILFSTFIGGSQAEGTSDIARGPTDGDIYLAGSTFSQNFPVTVGAFDRVWNGDPSIFWGDAFVAKIDLDATSSTPTQPPAVPAAPTLVSPANGSSQPQPITFDWNNTTSATSYQVQIDDSSAFTAPLVRDQTVTASEYSTTSLPTTTHFWRVRGVNVAGVAGAWSATRSFTPQAAPPTAQLATLDLNPSTVAGGTQSAGTAITDVSATDGGTVTLTSSNPAVASVPATATIAPNGFTATFAVSTVAVASNTQVTITASFNGATRSAILTVTGGAQAGPTLQSVQINPSFLTGGDPTSGFVSLSGAAPSGGAVVSLSSSNPAVASVPSSVTVGSGSSAWGFNVTTAAVSSTTTVTITATYDGISRTATLSLTAVAPPPPPPSTVTVTVTATGRSGERITSSPTGISVSTGSSGSASFAVGTSVRLTSTRDAVWSGACSSNGQKTKTCTFTANANTSVTANVQ